MKFPRLSLKPKKTPKKQKLVTETMKLLHSLKELEEKGALHINKETREIHLVREIFWDGKKEYWRKNFLKNCHFLMERHEKEKSNLPINVYAIDLDKKERGEFITKFLPEIGVF
jgi:hypothetical protein